MVNFTLKPEDTTFRVPGLVAYVRSPKVVSNSGTADAAAAGRRACRRRRRSSTRRSTPATTSPTSSPSRASTRASTTAALEGKVTGVNVGGVGQIATTELILERYRSGEEDPGPPTACGDCRRRVGGGQPLLRPGRHLPAGRRRPCTATMPLPGPYRICLTGGLATKLRAVGRLGRPRHHLHGRAGLGGSGPAAVLGDEHEVLRRPGRRTCRRASSSSVTADQILAGAVNLDRYSSLVVADDAFPGYVGAGPDRAGTGPDRRSRTSTGARRPLTAPCAYQPGTADVLPPTCYADFEFDVDGTFNNQSMTIALEAPNAVDYDLYLERQSRISGEWSPVGSAATGDRERDADDLQPAARPLPGPRRQLGGRSARRTRSSVTFSNVYPVRRPPASSRTEAAAGRLGRRS